MTLMLHAGASPADYETLRDAPVPAKTDTHVPLPHHQLVDLVKHWASYYGHEVVKQAFGLSKDANRFFGVLDLKSPYSEYTDTIGLRNSHDKTFPVGISFGSHVFVCDNLAFSADHVIRTKHTSGLKSRLPGLIGGLVEELGNSRSVQHQKIERYERVLLTEAQVDHCIMDLYRADVVNVKRIAEVWQEWATPSFEAFAKSPYSAWRLFNAVTFALRGLLIEDPLRSKRLHDVIDTTCEEVE